MTQYLIVTETEGWVAIPLGATAFSLNSDGRAFYGQAASAGDLAGVNGARMGYKDVMTSHGFRHTASTLLHENMHLHGIPSVE